MKVCTCFLVFSIFAYTNSISRLRQKGDYRGGHLAQKTVPEYVNEEYSGYTSNSDDVNSLEKRGTTLSNRNMKLVFRASKVETLTDFIQEAVKILNTYEDTAFEDFFHVLGDEIRKYHYRGCKFSELTQNSNTRLLLAGSLKFIRGKSVAFTKAYINKVADMMRDETYEKNVKGLLDYIDSLYINTKANFHSVLNQLKYYRKTKSMKTHNGLVQVIRGGLRDILFDHYTELNTNSRRELKKKIETFWKQLENNPTSSVEMYDISYTDPVIKSDGISIKALKHPEPYFKNNPQKKLKNKNERSVIIETDNELFHDDKTEINESGNEFWKSGTNYATNEISSAQSLDSSSNSIKNSQQRYEEYNTQRYMTLYTEEISYKAKATKKMEIISKSASVMTRRPIVKKRPMTKSKKIEMLRANHDVDDTKEDSSDSSHYQSSLTLESMYVPRAKENYDKQQKHGKADKSRSKHKNAHIISQYDAVIDVQLANAELLKSLGIFEPLGMDTIYDTTVYPKSAIQTEPLPKNPTIRSRSMRAHAQIKHRKQTAPTKPPLRYLKSLESLYRKKFDESKRSIVPNESHSVKQYKKDRNEKKKFIARRSNNITVGVKDFNKYVIKRINAIEKELNELKQMNDSSFRYRINDNNTDRIEVSSVSDKYEAKDNDGSKTKDMKGNDIERLLNKNHDLNNEEVNDGHTTRMNTESTSNNITSSEANVIKKDAVNATVTDNKNISQVINNNVNFTNNTKEINKEVITNNATSSVTSVRNTTKLVSVLTTPTVGITRTMAYSGPSYYPDPPESTSKSQFNSFGHDSDSFYLTI